MNNIQTKDLFYLQAELIEMKVDMAAGKAMDRVIEQIHELKNEMHGFRNDMNKRLASLDNRVIAIETRLGMINETRKEVRSRLMDYSFKAAWMLLGVVLTYLLIHFRNNPF